MQVLVDCLNEKVSAFRPSQQILGGKHFPECYNILAIYPENWAKLKEHGDTFYADFNFAYDATGKICHHIEKEGVYYNCKIIGALDTVDKSTETFNFKFDLAKLDTVD